MLLLLIALVALLGMPYLFPTVRPVLSGPAFALGVAVSVAMLRVTRRLLRQAASPK
ncbi:hypothetical protein SAMN03159443_03684 [Pseudomonas sp. NFACC15-1]|uniref:hypothetical protein n=1 Tax=unclassified Pseudomonas TaxID=196821 RepID=UPI00088FD45F|nr:MULTISPECIES: hypothetical protein [unclassified Pseudomonas]SDA85090.1 hypothetical protein SAMN03159443_03684 [Pseudomonas sp. NFACC15-1]SDW69765.1 hypothetical protein SAMN03159380_01011 [Pseudomonas sp. NFACC14]